MTYCNDDVIKLVFVIFVFDEVDDMVNGWYSLLNEAIDANAPLKRKRIRHDTKPKWLSPAILKLMKTRDRLLKKSETLKRS